MPGFKTAATSLLLFAALLAAARADGVDESDSAAALADVAARAEVERLSKFKPASAADAVEQLTAIMASDAEQPITKVDLSHIKIKGEILDLLCAAIEQGKIADIKILRLANSGLDAEATVQLARALQQAAALHELSLNYNSVGDRGVVALVENLRGAHLKELRLSYNNVGDEGVHALAGVMFQWTDLRVLGLGAGSITAAGAEHLRMGLPMTPYLRELQLYSNRLGDQGVSAIADLLHLLPKLKSLGLADNEATDASVVPLAEALHHCPKMVSLGLNDNHIGVAGGVAVGKALAGMPHLQDFFLGANAIGDEGAVSVAENLRHVPQLKTLGLYKNEITQAGAMALMDNLNYVKELLNCWIYQNDLTDVEALKDRAREMHGPMLGITV